MSSTIDPISVQKSIMIPETNTNNQKNDPIAEFANNFFSNISESLKTGLAFVGLATIENFGSKRFLAPGLSALNLTFYPKLPEFIHGYASNVIWILSKSDNSYHLNFRPLIIECLFRGVLQEGLLKRVPEKILKKVAPEYAPYVNATPAKIARITLSALAYSLGWAGHNSTTHLIEFARGILYGALQETTGTPLLGIAYYYGVVASND